MNQSLVSLIFVVVVGVCFFVYSLGFWAGESEGRGRGHKKGKEEGKKEGSVRAFAVGYDRGKREREKDDDQEEGGRASSEIPSLVKLVLVALGTVLVLTLVRAMR